MTVASRVLVYGEFRRGLRLVTPILRGTAAWGLVSGVAMMKTGLTRRPRHIHLRAALVATAVFVVTAVPRR